MTQQTQLVQSSSSGALSGLLASLRAGGGLKSLERQLFSSFLNEVSVAQTSSTSGGGSSSATASNVSSSASDSSCRSVLDTLVDSCRQMKKYQDDPHSSSTTDESSQSADDDADVQAAASDDAVAETDDVNTDSDTTEVAEETTEEETVTTEATEEEPVVETEETEVLAAATATEEVEETEEDAETAETDETAGEEGATDADAAYANRLMELERAAFLLFSQVTGSETGTTDEQTADGDAAESSKDGLLLAQSAKILKTALKLAARNESADAAADSAQGDASFESTTGDAFLSLLATKDKGLSLGGSLEGKGSSDAAAAVSSTPANQNQSDFLNLFSSANAALAASPSSAGSAPAVSLNATSAVSEVAGAGEVGAATGSSTGSATTNQLGTADSVRSASTYDFASHLSAARAAKNGATGLPSAVEQVVLQLHKQVKSGQDQMTVQLRPAELGRVEIKLQFGSDNKVQGTVVAETQAALDLLSKDVGSLQRALQEAGLRADPGCLQFSLSGQNQSGTYAQNESGSSSSSGSAWASESGEELSTADADGTETYTLAPGRINLRV